METVTVTEVEGPNDRGWYNITLEDGRKVDTKADAVAAQARVSAGNPVEAVIAERNRNGFTNYFLNAIDGVKENGSGGARRSTGTAGPTTGRRTGGKSPAEQDRIARQWAFGRAVELLTGSGQEFVFPLDTDTQKQLEETAAYLIEKTK